MAARFLTSGDKESAGMFKRQAFVQLDILHKLMSFQGLKQGRRDVKYSNGMVVSCRSLFNQDIVEIFMPVQEFIPLKEIIEPEIIEILCFCNCAFTEGVITEVISEGTGDYPEGEDYPDYCNENHAAVKNYTGIRYRVKVCQKENRKEYICIPSDFVGYEEGDIVILTFMGKWSGGIESAERSIPTCRNFDGLKRKSEEACKGNTRPGRLEDEADGAYIILPLVITSINESLYDENWNA